MQPFSLKSCSAYCVFALCLVIGRSFPQMSTCCRLSCRYHALSRFSHCFLCCLGLYLHYIFLLAVRTLHCFLKLTIIAFSERMHHMKLCHAAIYIVYSPLQKQHNTSSVCTPAIPVSCRHKAKLTVTFISYSVHEACRLQFQGLCHPHNNP